MPPAGVILALPLVKSLADCANYALTVEPFYQQLLDLPNAPILPGALKESLFSVYIGTNPLVTAFAFSLLLTPIFLIVSELNRNYSQVDRVWSILPTVYNIHYALWAHCAGIPTTRLDALAAASLLWSIRLTYNYWRRGGYEIGSEDYRWEIVRNYVPPVVFHIFNVVFISLAQSVLLFLITTPAYVLLLSGLKTGDGLSFTDLVFPSLLVGLVAFEFVADGQQWDFHKAKDEYKKNARVSGGWTQADFDRGFNSKGLFSWVRHPNFTGEQSVWVSVYLWSCVATQTQYNWTGLGAACYLILFQASTWLTELISARKYPEYKVYQQRVGKFLPSLFPLGGRSMDEPRQIKATAQNGSAEKETTRRTRKKA